MTTLDILKAVDAYGGSIAGVEWTSEPSEGHGYAVATLGPSAADRSGRDTRCDVYIRCCGFSSNQAAHTLDLVRAAFTDWRPFPQTRPDVKAEELDCGPLLTSTVPGDSRWSSTLLIRIET